MDQLKPAIEWCKKNIFWIGCFLLSAAMVGTWMMASSSLAEQQSKRETEISRRLTALQTVSITKAEPELPEVAHPNASTQAGMDAEINKTISSIVKAWRKNYQDQKKIMTWPEDILGKDTSDFFAEIEVPEKVSDPGFDRIRIAYYNRIPLFMDKICRELGTNWEYDKQLIARRKREAEAARFSDSLDSRGRSGGRDDLDDSTALLDELNRYPVIWERPNQDLWYQKLTVFQGYDDHTGPQRYPTFMQANMLQQDLWLLEAVFKNIKKTNGISNSNDTSAIQIIDHIVFGREAINKLGSLSEIDSRLASSGPAAAATAFIDDGTGGVVDYPTAPAPPTEADLLASRNAYHNRYVDPNFESISAKQVKDVLGGATLPETNLELIVAKRVPFRIALEIDERKINEFIAICANSEFVFEVNQLRVNRHLSYPGEITFNGGAKQDDDDMGGYTGGYVADELGADDDMYESDNLGSREPGEELKPLPIESRTDFMVSVEFYGVVKIYNPVRENFLRLAAGQDVVDETADLVEEAPEEPATITPPPEAPVVDDPAVDPSAATAPAGNPPAGNPPVDGGSAQPQPPVEQPAAGGTTPDTAPAPATP